ncbi:hypothetical protein BJ741DRAFT_615591 [Chytriomyces cf. hyalinus JEL632]|nr:hypothetical protein BJ741DRAFT_615591 [Chytriomyces cf. hyalinus JEL632]
MTIFCLNDFWKNFGMKPPSFATADTQQKTFPNMAKLSKLDALMDDLDATLLELDFQDNAPQARLAPVSVPTPHRNLQPLNVGPAPTPTPVTPTTQMQNQLMVQQQEQLRLQQQLIEIQTALLKQQQLPPQGPLPPQQTIPVAVPPAGIMPPRAQFSPYSPMPRQGAFDQQQQHQQHQYQQQQQQQFGYNTAQVQHDQLAEYNKSLKSWSSDLTRKSSAFSHDSPTLYHDSDLQSVSSAGSQGIPGISGGGVFGKKSGAGDGAETASVSSSEKKRGWFGGAKKKTPPASMKQREENVLSALESVGF